MKLENTSCVNSEFDQSIDEPIPLAYCIKKTFNERKLTKLQEQWYWMIYKNPEIVFHPSTDINNKNNNNLIFRYIYPLIKKMRLFKEGNICMPLHYCYGFHKNSPRLISGVEYGSYVIPEPYTLTKSEINEFKNNIQDVELPFTKDFLQLAFENFELSYEIQNKNMQFLTLMNGMEALFHPSREGELTFRISRNAAVLLGKDREDSKIIYKNMKDLYGKRSNIVHNGRADISDEDLLKLRQYARESIKKMVRINKNKQDILNRLNEYGFGEGEEIND